MEQTIETDELFQKADWKKEKHVPVIECPRYDTRRGAL
jgi:desulfoferrodoxin (superoxide reductase-like protein)